MTTPQITFWSIAVGLSLPLTVLAYPGVKRHAKSPRESWIASFMAAALFSTFVAMVVSSIVNAIAVNVGG